MVKKGGKGHRVLQEVLLSTSLISAEQKKEEESLEVFLSNVTR